MIFICFFKINDRHRYGNCVIDAVWIQVYFLKWYPVNGGLEIIEPFS